MKLQKEKTRKGNSGKSYKEQIIKDIIHTARLQEWLKKERNEKELHQTDLRTNNINIFYLWKKWNHF